MAEGNVNVNEVKEEMKELQKSLKNLVKVAEGLKAAGLDTTEIEEKKKQTDLELRELESQIEEEPSKSKQRKLFKAFMSARELYYSNRVTICFHRGSVPRFFFKSTTINKHRTTNQDLPESELVFNKQSELRVNFNEVSQEEALMFFRRMIHGEFIRVTDPDTGNPIEEQFESRVYTKLANTNNIPGPDVFNLVDLSQRMLPSGNVVKDCPPTMYALLLSLSGNTRTWEQDHWKVSKPENLEWLEKWFYGVLHADIGNPLLSMPVFFGAGKIGKNAMFDVLIPKILGKHCCFSSTWDTIDGNFNSFKIGKVILFIDEVPPREDWGKLKNLTGSPEQFVKEKYGPEFKIDNTITNAIGSNQEVYPLPLEEGKQMVRVSPIKVTSKSTFAENIVSVLGEEFVKKSLEDVGVKQDWGTLYSLGDAYLKLLPQKWQSTEILQEWLDYLHTKFGESLYHLEPLRGKDWEDIQRTQPNSVKAVVEYIKEVNPESISLPELYEIYKTIMDGNRYVMHSQKFAIWVKTELSDLGYLAHARISAKMSGGNERTQTTIYSKRMTPPMGYALDYSKYIYEEMIGNKLQKRLNYGKGPETRETPTSGFGDI